MALLSISRGAAETNYFDSSITFQLCDWQAPWFWNNPVAVMNDPSDQTARVLRRRSIPTTTACIL